jgi:peptidoglycan/xylan/chitin deacetylase (PgdA/CDA1 family)
MSLAAARKALRRRLRPLRPLADAVQDRLHHARERRLNRRSPPLVVLIYHRVIELPADPQMLAVHPARFGAHLQALKQHFDILRFDEDWSGRHRPAVVITFDDGYADNLEHALPLLQTQQVPATFFIATGYIGAGREFWWDEIEQLLLAGRTGPRLQALGPIALEHVVDLADAGQRQALYEQIHPRLKKLDIEGRESALQALRAALGCDAAVRDTHRVMDLDGLRRMAASELVTLGAHTVWHQPLSSLPAEKQRAEIDRSRAMLQDWTDRPIRTFSYPFGNHDDYSAHSVALCRELGFSRVAANHPAVVREATDPMQIPRFLVRDWPADELLRRLRRFAGL